MTEPKGRLDLDSLRHLVEIGEIETVIVGFTDHYGRLLGKRYDAELETFTRPKSFHLRLQP